MTQSDYRAQQEDKATPDLRRYLSLLFNNIKLICIIVSIISVIACIVSYILPKQYQAESTVSIEQSIVSDFVKGIAVTSSVESKMRLLKVHLLSRGILEKVASLLDMDLLTTSPQEKEALIQSLRNRIQISHDEKRGLFNIMFEDPNPVLARDFVNTITRLYIEESTQEKRLESDEAIIFLSDQISTLEKRIAEAQIAIDAFKSDQGMYLGLNEQLLRQQIKETEQRLEALRIRKNELTAKQLLLSDTSVLTEQLRSKELALQSARTTYTDRHPEVKRLLLDIKGLKELIAEREENANEPLVSAEYQNIKVELQSIVEMETNLGGSLAESIKELEALPSIRTKLAELQQRKDNEMRMYDQLMIRLSQSKISAGIEKQDKAVSFRIIDAAVTPTIHVFPKRYIFMIGGIIVGFAIAGAIVLGNDLLRGKVRSAHDLKAYGLKILIKLPNTASTISLAKQKWTTHVVVVCTAVLLFLICTAAVIEFLNLPYIEKLIAALQRIFIA